VAAEPSLILGSPCRLLALPMRGNGPTGQDYEIVKAPLWRRGIHRASFAANAASSFFSLTVSLPHL
jgi:hypothetical protein